MKGKGLAEEVDVIRVTNKDYLASSIQNRLGGSKVAVVKNRKLEADVFRM